MLSQVFKLRFQQPIRCCLFFPFLIKVSSLTGLWASLTGSWNTQALGHLLCCRSVYMLVGQFGRLVKHPGPYAWVHGRRATSKVTATSGGRLTNRYAWVPGRLTRRACLGVNLPLRVPPCKQYPEEVTELKMAALILLRYRQRRLLRRNRIFRDRTNPSDKFNDLELFGQFRFRRADILQMTNELKEELEHLNRKGALPPVFTGRRTALNILYW